MAVPADRREIRLLPAPGKQLSHDKPIPYDWHLRVLGELRGAVRESEVADNRATLTVYIPEPLPPPLADPKAARKWIADLDRDDFKTRDRAAGQRAALGTSVGPTLRETLKGKQAGDGGDRGEESLG